MQPTAAKRAKNSEKRQKWLADAILLMCENRVFWKIALKRLAVALIETSCNTVSVKKVSCLACTSHSHIVKRRGHAVLHLLKHESEARRWLADAVCRMCVHTLACRYRSCCITFPRFLGCRRLVQAILIYKLV